MNNPSARLSADPTLPFVWLFNSIDRAYPEKKRDRISPTIDIKIGEQEVQHGVNTLILIEEFYSSDNLSLHKMASSDETNTASYTAAYSMEEGVYLDPTDRGGCNSLHWAALPWKGGG